MGACSKCWISAFNSVNANSCYRDRRLLDSDHLTEIDHVIESFFSLLELCNASSITQLCTLRKGSIQTSNIISYTRPVQRGMTWISKWNLASKLTLIVASQWIHEKIKRLSRSWMLPYLNLWFERWTRWFSCRAILFDWGLVKLLCWGLQILREKKPEMQAIWGVVYLQFARQSEIKADTKHYSLF